MKSKEMNLINFTRRLPFRYGVPFGLALLISIPTVAYVPSSKMILSRVVRHGGKGAYVIDQDVSFNNEKPVLTLHEHWVIENALSMRVSVSSKTAAQPVRLEILYRDGNRTIYDQQGQVRSVVTSHEFIEPYLFYRTEQSLISSLIKSKILPSDFIRSMRPPVTNLQNVKYPPEVYTRLARTGGVVDYELGETPGANTAKAVPGIWIEQDGFVLRRLRWPSQAEVAAERQADFAGGLRLPRERTVSWGGNTVSIHVTSVKAVKDISAAVSAATFNAAAGEKTASVVPETASVKEFYSRFR